MMVLMGGVHHLWGSVAGSVFLKGLGAEMARHFEYWRGFLGLVIMLLVVFAPEGILGTRWTPRMVRKSINQGQA
jgi:branched-chain amino acid transport system permease protein